MVVLAWSDVSHHLDALLLALASSTDNFTVGLSVGIRQKPLAHWTNGCISICNAAGAWVAGHGGLWVSRSLYVASSAKQEPNENDHSSSFPLYFSAISFGGLAFSEWRGYKEEIGTNANSINGKKDDDGGGHEESSEFTATTSYSTNNNISPQSNTMSSIWPVLKLAIPMTLNNLAGGVAGGAAGLTPQMSALYALLASFVTMLVGHRVGLRVGSAMTAKKGHNKLWIHPSLVSAILLGILCLLTLQEAIFG